MHAFHVFVHTKPGTCTAGREIQLPGCSLPTLRVPDQAALSRFHIDFDSVAVGLQGIPNLHFEPDGWFLVSDPSGAWQVQGVVHDQGHQIAHLELKGNCYERAPLIQIIETLDTPITDLLVQFAEQGLFVDWETFLRFVRT